MRCKVLCVYKDVNRKQCMIDYEVNGVIYKKHKIADFVNFCKSGNIVQENFKLIPDGVSGKCCNLKFK